MFALIDRDHRILRTTEGFRTLSLDAAAACEGSQEIESVLSGSAQTGTIVIGETRLDISPVTDGAGAPHALLSLPADAADEPHPPPSSDDWVPGLRASVEHSPVLAWLKDTAGCHLYVNRRYLETLQVGEDRLLGRTDAELSPGETVDGPRRSLAADGIEEPQELEYTVPAFGQRPALAAVRFLVRGSAGEVLGICGLAGPLEQAQLVRQEADRIAAAQRSPGAATQEDLLREWGLARSGHPAPESGEEVEVWVEPEQSEHPTAPEQALDLVQRWDEWRSILQQAQEQLTQAVAQRDAAQQEHDRLQGERDELDRALAAERMRNQELVRTIEQLRIQISDVGRTIEHALPGEAQAIASHPGA